MIEQLRDTAVKVENERQARCVAALYELAGFKKCGGNDFDGYVSSDADSYFVGGVTITDEKLITINQLAWDYGLAPDWAVDLRVKDGNHGWTNADNTAQMLDGKLYHHKSLGGEIISTRPQKQPQWPDGGLPPMGSECEYSIGSGFKDFRRCTFVGVNSNGSYVIEKEFEVYKPFECHQIRLRPIQSERDRLIGLACKVADEKCSKWNVNIDCSAAMKAIIEELANAGMLKDNV